MLSITFSLHCFYDSGMDPILAQVKDKDLLRRVLSKVQFLGLNLCLCLCQTNLLMRVATSKQTKTVHTLLCHQQRRLSTSLCDSTTQRSQVCVCLRSQKHSFQLGSPSSDSMRAALSICRRRSHQVAWQLGARTAILLHQRL